MTHPIFPSTLPSTSSPTSPRSRRVERERERERKRSATTTTTRERERESCERDPRDATFHFTTLRASSSPTSLYSSSSFLFPSLLFAWTSRRRFCCFCCCFCCCCCCRRWTRRTRRTKKRVSLPTARSFPATRTKPSPVRTSRTRTRNSF